MSRILPYLLAALVLAGCDPGDTSLSSGGSQAVSGAGESGEKGPEVTEKATEKKPSFEIGLAAMNRRTPILMYHDIIKERGRDNVWFDCTVDEFKKQMEILELGGYTPISMDDLHAHLTGGKELPEKPVLLSFDDNYQGFYDNAWPILKEKGWPAIMYVHTGFVGKGGSHPKMTWDTLRELVKDPLITIGSHTINHLDMSKLDETKQREELEVSKNALEKELGITIKHLSYPEGKHNDITVRLAKELGYVTAVTIDNGPAELSPGILRINRYIHTRIEKALEDADLSLKAAPKTVIAKRQDGPVMFEEVGEGRNKIVMIKGGSPMTITSATRESVSEFIERTPTAVAGINGTFFSLAAIAATDNKLVGPCITPDNPTLLVDPETFRYPKLRNRPIIFWNDEEVVITPFAPERFNQPEWVAEIQTGTKNMFLGGAWLVHEGKPFEEKVLRAFAAQDVMDWRRRAAFGLLTDGRFFAAASRTSVSSLKFAEMLAEAGVQEAILLDSGFSTSLVYNKKVLASGHSTKEKPSRPVPHAILFEGELDPASVALAEKTEPATVERSTRRRRR